MLKEKYESRKARKKKNREWREVICPHPSIFIDHILYSALINFYMCNICGMTENHPSVKDVMKTL